MADVIGHLAPELGAPFADDQGAEGAGYTVWRHAGKMRDGWHLAFSGPELEQARAYFDGLAFSTKWGCVRLLDPIGRELAFQLGRAETG